MSTTSNITRGFVAGVLGVIGMAGTSFTMRRLVEPTAPIGETHYEKVVKRAHGLVQPEGPPLDREVQVRLGEAAHLAFGGFWGAVFALTRRQTPVRPLRDGLGLGTAIWALAFGGYMPKLNISRSLKQMDWYEASRTWICHVTFAGVMALALDRLQRTSDRAVS